MSFHEDLLIMRAEDTGPDELLDLDTGMIKPYPSESVRRQDGMSDGRARRKNDPTTQCIFEDMNSVKTCSEFMAAENSDDCHLYAAQRESFTLVERLSFAQYVFDL